MNRCRMAPFFLPNEEANAMQWWRHGAISIVTATRASLAIMLVFVATAPVYGLQVSDAPLHRVATPAESGVEMRWNVAIINAQAHFFLTIDEAPWLGAAEIAFVHMLFSDGTGHALQDTGGKDQPARRFTGNITERHRGHGLPLAITIACTDGSIHTYPFFEQPTRARWLQNQNLPQVIERDVPVQEIELASPQVTELDVPVEEIESEDSPERTEMMVDPG